MKQIVGIGLLLMALLLAACDELDNTVKLTGSGNSVEQTYDVADFDRVDAAQTFDVTITHGATFSVLVRADDNVMGEVEVKQKDNTLTLGLKGNSYTLKNVTLEAEIVMPELAAISLSGSSSGHISGFESGAAFDARISGMSTLDLDLVAGNVLLDQSGSSQTTGIVVASGQLTLNLGGNSAVTLDGRAGEGLVLHLAGSSTITLSEDFAVAGAVNALSGGGSTVTIASTNEIGALILDLSGSSVFDMHEANTGNVTLKALGGSKVTLTGSGGVLNIEAAGSSVINLGDFAVADTTITASGGSTVDVNVNGTLNVDASGASRITYQGDPTLGTIDTSGGATVEAAG